LGVGGFGGGGAGGVDLGYLLCGGRIGRHLGCGTISWLGVDGMGCVRLSVLVIDDVIAASR